MRRLSSLLHSLLCAGLLLLCACSELQLWYDQALLWYDSTTGSSEPQVYKEASFKSWLLFDTVDTYYAPVRLSRAPFAQYLIPQQREGSGREGFESKEDVARCSAILPVAKSQPNRYPWQANESADINPFIEEQNLAQIAEACYEGQEGTIWYIPGRRIRREVTNFDALLTAGQQIPCYHYLPARFVTQSPGIELSRLMDNLWLLYRLAQGGWITPQSSGGTTSWSWSAKALSPPAPAAGETTLAELPGEVRSRLPVLGLISGGSEGACPAIPCRVHTTREAVSVPTKEMALMRKDEGCEGFEFLSEPTPEQLSERLSAARAEQEKRELGFEEIGVQVDPGKPLQTAAMTQDKAYTPDRSMAQYSLFICPRALNSLYAKGGYFYAIDWNTGQVIRPCTTIFRR